VGRREALCLAASVAGVVMVVRPGARTAAGAVTIVAATLVLALRPAAGAAPEEEPAAA
jgi:drug/metabolite transporter (DMT)-like permease